MSNTRFNIIKSKNPKVEFLTSTTHQLYSLQLGLRTIDFNCKDLTVYNSGDYEVILEGEIRLQPGQSISYGADAGEYQTGQISFRFGSLIGPDADKQYFTVIRKEYAE